MKKEVNFDRLMQESFSWARAQKKQSNGQYGTAESECLSEETTCDYLESRLPAAEHDKAEEHFSFCPACRQLLITLAKVERLERKELNDLEAKPQIRQISETAGEKIAGSRIMSGIGTALEALKISLAWAKGCLVLLETNADLSLSQNTIRPSPIRGDLHQPKTELGPFSKIIQGHKVIAQVGIEQEGKSCELRLEVYPLIGEGSESAISESAIKEPAIKVDVLQADRILYSYPLEGDAVLLNGITPGGYEVRIRKANHLVALLSLEIKEE